MFEGIVIVDDQPADAELLNLIRAAFFGIDVRAATSLEAALGPTQNLSKRSLLLLEPALRGRFDMEVLSRVRTLRPELPVAVRSANVSRAAIRAALKAGALGYFPKTIGSKLFVAGLRCVAAGGIFVPPQVLDDEWADDHSFRTGDRALTAGQTRVLRLLLAGRSNREIARELNNSEGTVKQHVYALFRALRVTSRAALIAGVATNALQHFGKPPGEI